MLQWPNPWLIETQSVIPKKDDATSFDQLRNLSCTNSFSKILETFVLERIRTEVTLCDNQYGGIRGSGTNHYLVDCWDKILRSLDLFDSAVSLLLINFSKVFDRMSHAICIRALADSGASSETLALVASFLRVKIISSLSKERLVKGGSPQGPNLGNYLFIITINTIDPEDDEDTLCLRHIAERICAVRHFNSRVDLANTPQKMGATDGVPCYWDESGRENIFPGPRPKH